MAGPFGAVVEGIDVPTLTAVDVAELADALSEHHVLLLRDQHLSSEAFVGFGRSWGELRIYGDARKRDTTFPELTVLHNRESTPSELRDSAQNWHSDASYDPVPMSVTMMSVLEAPDEGGETLFCSTLDAWRALPPELKLRATGRTALHRPKGDERLLLAGELRGDLGHEQAPARHPLVIVHPVTGERVLYAVSGSPYHVEGMIQEDAITLLLELKRHCAQDQFIQSVKGAVGDVVLWDNFAVMHSATPTRYTDADGERRVIHRLTVLAEGPPAPWVDPARVSALITNHRPGFQPATASE